MFLLDVFEKTLPVDEGTVTDFTTEMSAEPRICTDQVAASSPVVPSWDVELPFGVAVKVLDLDTPGNVSGGPSWRSGPTKSGWTLTLMENDAVCPLPRSPKGQVTPCAAAVHPLGLLTKSNPSINALVTLKPFFSVYGPAFLTFPG